MLCPRGGREESSVSSLHNGVPRDQCSRRRGIISQNSSQGSVNIMWLLGLLLFLIFNGFWWFVWGVGYNPSTRLEEASRSPLICQHPYGKYLVIDKIHRREERIGNKPSEFVTFTTTVKNIGSREVTDIEGYWLLVDGNAREHRENIYISSRLSPGDSKEISLQKRVDRYFLGVGASCKVVFENVKLNEAVNSP